MYKLMDNYKIRAIIKGEKHTLRNVGPPAFISNDEVLDKNMTRSYILSKFRDIIKDKNDVEETKYYQGRKIIKNFEYPKDWNSTTELMSKLLNAQK